MLMTDVQIAEAVKKQEEENRAKGLVKCQCGNWFEVKLTNCPMCRVFNNATTSSHCPTCNQKIKNDQGE